MRAGGICGDFLGATQQLGVIAVLAPILVGLWNLVTYWFVLDEPGTIYLPSP